MGWLSPPTVVVLVVNAPPVVVITSLSDAVPILPSLVILPWPWVVLDFPSNALLTSFSDG